MTARALRFGPIGLAFYGALAERSWPDVALPFTAAPTDTDVAYVTMRGRPTLAWGRELAHTPIWRATETDCDIVLDVLASDALAVQVALGPRTLTFDERYALGPQPLWFSPLVQLLVTHAGLARGALLLHAACVEVNGEAWLFCGRSGAGKSTSARRLVSRGHKLVSEDRTLVLVDAARAYATPFSGSNTPSAPSDLPLGRIHLVAHGQANRSERLSAARAAAQLAAISIGPFWDAALTEESLALACALARRAPTFATALTFSDEAGAHLIANALVHG